MEKLTVFYLDGCPYCRNARKAFAELAAETPEYGETEVNGLRRAVTRKSRKGGSITTCLRFTRGKRNFMKPIPASLTPSARQM